METKSPPMKLSENPVKHAQSALSRIRVTARLCVILPLVLLAATSCVILFFFGDRWLADRYLAMFLGLLFVIFAFGQFMAIFQIRRILPVLTGSEKVLDVLKDAGDEPDLETLRLTLLQKAPESLLRDLLLRWIELGLRGETVGSEALLENAWERRSINDNRMISFHVSLNRTTLKLGFLGTLIGIILTFPPMKRAVMGLADSQGELKFIKDIAATIDGDEYAILNTLIATGLSIFVEFITIQLLERVLGGFDVVNSHINDWNITRLQPWIRRHYGIEAKTKELQERQGRMEQALIQAQQALEKHMSGLGEALKGAANQLDQIAKVQSLVGKRVSELTEYERQYRSFLTSKHQAAGPHSSHPDPAGST